MYTLKVENKAGQQFTLTGNESAYQIISVTGLNPPNATIQSSSVAGMDGSRFASAKLGERNIVLTIKINGDVETNRLYLYRFFKTKQYSKLYFEHGLRSVYAEGYVETIECDLFTNNEQMQVSIVCQDPYLKDIEEIAYDISQVVGQFTFPFSIEEPIEFSIIDRNRIVNVVNVGDAESGFIIEITALGTVTNPAIYSLDTGESFKVNCSLSTGDVLTINSIAGEKSVMFLHDGEVSNYLRYVNKNSNWLKVQQGDNQFTHGADSGSDLIQMIIKFRTRYEAV